MAKGKTQSFKSRSAILLALILVLGFGAAAFRIGWIQTVQSEELRKKAVAQQLTDTTLSAKRGSIYDRNMELLAESATVWRVVLAPVYLKTDEDRRIVAKGLAEILEMDEEKIFEKSQQNSYYVELKRQIESDTRQKILDFCEVLQNEYDINGSAVYLLDDYKRYYHKNDLASAVIGFTGSDDQGLSGVEYQYDEVLTGTPGRLVTATNSVGTEMPFKYSQNIDAVDGSSLVLTIDSHIQAIVEKYLKEGIEENAVYNRAVGIVMNVNNGEILAMASVGGFDLNDPFTLPDEILSEMDSLVEKEMANNPTDPETGEPLSEDAVRAIVESNELSKMWRNKAVSDTYYPGSVFKMFTAAMAVEEGLVTDESSFYCPGYYTVTGEILHCHLRSGHGTQNFRDCIKNSCNPAFMQIGELIGTERFYKYYQSFGFSDKTGVDLPGEAGDIFFSEDGSMLPINLATASFGQNFAITPIQMATAVCAIANGGYIVQPHVVSQILDSEGNITSTVSTEVKRQAISSETAAHIANILEENAVSGSGSNGYVAGYRVAGKTGTTEKKVDLNSDGVDDYIASFCGFAPAEDAEVVCLVFFDTPTGANYYGSQVAAPVFAKIMSEVLPYLEVPTQYTDEEIASLDVTVGSYVGMTPDDAISEVEGEGFTVTVKGEGDKVLAQMPRASMNIPKGGNVVLYLDKESATEQVEVPDFKGYNISNVNYLASLAGVNVSITGAVNSALSMASSQSIAPGTLVSEGTVITVNFTSGGVSD